MPSKGVAQEQPRQGKPKRETWSDWLPDQPAAVSIDGLVDLANRNPDANMDTSTIRYWQKVGILPNPIRKRVGSGVNSFYPLLAVTFLNQIRSLQKEGLSLKDIRPRIRGYATSLNNLDPYDLTEPVTSAVRIREKQSAQSVKFVSVTFHDDDGTETSLLFNRNGRIGPKFLDPQDDQKQG